jgi:hypothetical protein
MFMGSSDGNDPCIGVMADPYGIIGFWMPELIGGVVPFKPSISGGRRSGRTSSTRVCQL